MTSVSIRSIQAVDPAMLDDDTLLAVPAFLCPIPAGWPSPAEDYIESTLDLNRLLIRNQPSTFIVTVAGDSMTGVGIHDGDRLIVDKSLRASPGKVVIASVDGEFTVKTIEKRGCRMYLKPHAEGYPEIDITDCEDAMIWG